MAERLNVVVVVLDGARADHLSCYGYARETTPFLDQMAREGVRFTQMIATAPWTLPAHAALFTGLHSVTHGATDESRFLPTRHKLLAEYVKSAGWRTAAFCTNPWVSPETNFGRGFDAFFTQRHHNRLAARALFYGRKASDRLLRRHDAGARRTNHALQKWLSGGDQPFFAFVHYNETHLPVNPPPPYSRLFLPKGVTPKRAAATKQEGYEAIAAGVETSVDSVTIVNALYDGALRYVDHHVREIAETLRARGEWERTLLIVTGDHGEHLGEQRRFGHAFTLADAVLRVPLLVRCPSHVPQGFAVEELAQTTDIVPTILNLLGIADDSEHRQGRPLLDAGRATPGPAFAISERFRPNVSALQKRFPEFDVRPYDVRQKAIRTKREKFIWHSDEANEFYDLVTDPREECNLIEIAAPRADALRRQLFDWLASVDKFAADEQPVGSNEAMRQQLQGLGYLD